MAVLEVFIHRGCWSEPAARQLADEIQKACPEWQVHVVDNRERARTLGIVVFPAFVLDGHVVAVGVPGKDRLLGLLSELKGTDQDGRRGRPRRRPGKSGFLFNKPHNRRT